MIRVVCPGCEKRYGYAVDRCTFCGASLAHDYPHQATVVAVTEVSVPSIGHEDVPYWCALVESAEGQKAVVKLDRPTVVGESLYLQDTEERELETVGIIGTGVMGKGLVELLLQRGHPVIWVSRSLAALESGREKAMDRLARSTDEDDLLVAMERLTLSVDFESLGSCDVVIEAVLEELEPKKDVLVRAEAAMRTDAVLATNTSGLPVDGLADVLQRPDRFGVLHFFNPAARMRLVEISRAQATSDDTMARLEEFSVSLGKRPIAVAARPAFVVNRVLMPLINEAVRSLEEEAAPPGDIDEAIRLGLNHPMGPLALADLIGLDVVVDIMDNLVAETGDDSYAARPLLRRLVDEGALGRKSRRGFFDYS